MYCDYAIFNNIAKDSNNNAIINIDYLKQLKDGDNLFIGACYVPNIDEIFKNVISILKMKQIKINFYILYEPLLPSKYILSILPYSIKIFLTNNEYDHPQIHHLPIGIRDGEEVNELHKGFSQKTLLEESKIIRNKKYLCLLCFSSAENRKTCEDSLKDKPFVLNLNEEYSNNERTLLFGKVPLSVNYEKTHESWYVLSPPGVGIDCHRFYEAIYLNAIPIVKRTNNAFDKLYNVFPCMIIDNWDDINEKLLEDNKEIMMQKLVKFKNDYPNYMTDFEIINKILLNT